MNKLNLQNLSLLAKLNPAKSLDESEFMKILEFIDSIKTLKTVKSQLPESRTSLRVDIPQTSLSNLDSSTNRRLNDQNYFEIEVN